MAESPHRYSLVPVTAPITEHEWAGVMQDGRDTRIGFRSPVAMFAGDLVRMDVWTGECMAVYRQGEIIYSHGRV